MQDPAGSTARWTENRADGPRLRLGELWTYRDVARVLAVRDFKLRYQQTFFGIAWAVLQPLVAMAVVVLVLGRVEALGADTVSYVAVVITGLAVWFATANAIDSAAESLASAPELITKVYFPRLLAPLGAAAVMAVDLAIALVLAVVVVLIAGEVPDLRILALPLCLVAAVVAALAIGLWFAALNVLYRDVRYALPFVVQVLFFASPVVYASTVVPDDWAWAYFANPVAAVIELTRWSVLGTPIEPAALVALGSTAALLAGGIAFFSRTEQQFADRV